MCCDTAMTMIAAARVEHDFLGEKLIPGDAYWDVHTARAVENFPISGTLISAMPDLIRACGFVKKAAARANVQLGALDPKHADPIIAACEALIAGEFLDEFVVDVIQGGTGTSTNMNANEVIANVALEKMGYAKGSYDMLPRTIMSMPRRAPMMSTRPPFGSRCGRRLIACLGQWRYCAWALRLKPMSSRMC